MARSSSSLRPDDIAGLPGGCSRCLQWERLAGATVNGDGTADGTVDGTGLVDKQRWWTQTLAAGTGGGVVIRLGSSQDEPSRIVGYATYAVPDRSGRDALTVLGLHVDAGHRGRGLGRMLVQAVARDALRRPRVRAVEATAGRGGPDCRVPLDFWLACGFAVTRPHPLTPTVRLDARVLAAWRSEVEGAFEQAWGRLRGAVRPDPVPGPALSGQPRSHTPAP